MTNRTHTLANTANHWKNWSGLQQSNPQHYAMPHDLAALSQVIRQSSKCRVVGAGHSFTPLVSTDDTLISLDGLSGLVRHDQNLMQSTIHAGTRLKNLGPLLAGINQGLANQGDIDEQSLAGAVATGTHGTGQTLTCLSGLVEGFQLVSADGELLECDRTQNSEIFTAGRVALGCFGVLSQITMQNVPSYRLKEQVKLMPLQDILDNMDQWKTEHRHIECFVFAHGSAAMLKTLDPTTDEIQTLPKAWPSEDTLLTACCELTRTLPSLGHSIQKMLGVFIKPTTRVDWSSNIFPAVRETRFNEMEYQIPAAQGLACLTEVVSMLKKHKAPVFFPIEYRYVKGDDIWLSPFYQQDSASISIHQYHKQDCREIFKLIEPIFWKYQGRPHWGKLHTLGCRELKPLYPRWDDFMAIRETLDPTRKWLNPHLSQLFIE
ncbi:D-arabinono-1,4-lactone oxidase [Aquirhabdus parva]|uniref:FAD-binding protein n=1 Tax=Aquirhabdus parva TaxID=2283318 RepID=A0A345PBN3_9GAMM|nr:D-arabinono-1,4-lactone oxidase [Aquirhabdus parva]AXI04692.1 FAD-binding protein [Aquirhabdus parva]